MPPPYLWVLNPKYNKINFHIITPGSSKKGSTLFEKVIGDKVQTKKAPKELFELDSMTIIYGENVAHISQKTDFSTTLIRNKDIAQTQRTIFQNLWRLDDKITK